MTNGYDFYIDGVLLPIAPPSLKIKVGSTNKVVSLINEGEINILKSPSLIDVSFTARFPMRPYPYAPKVNSFESYWEKFKSLKEGKKPFQFIVSRTNSKGQLSWDTNLKMAIETLTINEESDNGDDVLIDFTLKQYKEYGTKVIPIETNSARVSVTNKSDSINSKSDGSESYTIKYGDTLWALAQKYYGDGSQYPKIYNANKAVMDAEARKHGFADANKGNYLWPNCTLVIPK